MFARVLYVGSAPHGQADFGFRIIETLRSAGHAVRACLFLEPGAAAEPELAASMAAFRPTLVLWDVTARALDEVCASVLCGQLCCKVALLPEGVPPAGVPMQFAECFDFLLLPEEKLPDLVGWKGMECAMALPCGPDSRYRQAVASKPSAVKLGIACSQVWDERRQGQLEEARSVCGSAPLVALDSTWPSCLYVEYPGACAAYYLRQARYFVCFDGIDHVTLPDIALRIAEGCLVLAEEGALSNLLGEGRLVGSPPDGLPDGRIVSTIASFPRGGACGLCGAARGIAGAKRGYASSPK